MNISINFKLLSFQPGSRKFNQGVFEPVTDFLVQVEVPVKYLVNGEKYITEPMQGNKAPIPILTIEGWAYVEDQFLNRKVAIEQTTEDDIEWEKET